MYVEDRDRAILMRHVTRPRMYVLCRCRKQIYRDIAIATPHQ